MARTYSLATILAIAIPLGVVALAAILSLTFVVLRISLALQKERAAYAMHRAHGAHRKTEEVDAENGALPHERSRRKRRGFWDVLCCIPSTEYYSSHASPSFARFISTDKPDVDRAGDSARPVLVSGSHPSLLGDRKGEITDDDPLKDDLKLEQGTGDKKVDTGPSEQLLSQTVAAIQASAKQESLSDQLGDSNTPLPAEPPFQHPESPEPAVLSGTVPSQSLDVEHDKQPDVGDPTEIDTANVNNTSLLYAASPSVRDSLLRASLWLSHYSGDTPRSGASSLTDSQKRIKQDIGSPLELQMKASDSALRRRNMIVSSQAENQQHEVSHFDDVPLDGDFPNYNNNVADLVPPARSAFRPMTPPRVSPVSSRRGLQSPLRVHEVSSKSSSPSKVPQPNLETDSFHSIYETPPVAPLVPIQKIGPLNSPSRLRKNEQSRPPLSLQQVGGIERYSASPSGHDPTLSGTAAEDEHKHEDRVASNDQEGATEQPFVRSGGSDVDKSSQHHAADLEHQRILRLLKGAENLHEGNEHIRGDKVDKRRTMLASFAGSLVRGSIDKSEAAAEPLETMPASKVQRHSTASTPSPHSYHDEPHSAGSSTDNLPTGIVTSDQEWANSSVSLAPTALDKLFGHSGSGMELPLLEGSDGSKSRRRKKSRSTVLSARDSSIGSPLTVSTNSPRHSSRSSSLTASTAWLSPRRSSRASTDVHSVGSEPTRSMQPLSIKASSSIRDIALLSVPRTPRSPGYSPGQMSVQPASPVSPSPKTGKVTRRLSTFAYGFDGKTSGQNKEHNSGGMSLVSPKNLAQQEDHPSDDSRRSGKGMGSVSPKQGHPRARVSKSTRMNKPLPTMPDAVKYGLLANLNGARYVVVQEYTRNLSDEISLSVDDVVRVYQVFDDGWCLVRTGQQGGQKGVYPHACLRPLA